MQRQSTIRETAQRALTMELMLLAAAALLMPSAAGPILYLGATIIMPFALLWPAPAHRGSLQAWAHVRARLRATYAALLAAARALAEILVPSSSPAPARLVDDPPPALRLLISSFLLRAPPLR